MLNRLLIVGLAIMLLSNIKAQQIPQTFSGKTHMISTDELLQKKSASRAFSITAPPEGDIRSIAEFERAEGVIVTYLNGYSGGRFGIPLNLIAEMSEDAIVYTVVSNSQAQNRVERTYRNNGVKMENVEYVRSRANSYWTRDYSPWFIAVDNEVSIVDFPYNRPRPYDDDMPIVFGDYLNMDIYGMDLVSTGGNYMSDGLGIGASCELVYKENTSLSANEVAKLAKDYLGLEKYHIVKDPLDDYIEHIDCWGKFLDVDKILITRVPQSDRRYADFEAMADYWANQTSSYGNKFQVFRVYSPNGQPYTNSLILNEKVFVPIVSGTGSQYNETALDVYRKAMPGYEVIGYYPASNAPWESTDALHCRTHEVPDRDMLYINHKPILNACTTTGSSAAINASVSSFGGSAIQKVMLNYKINGGQYQQKELISKQGGQVYHTEISGLREADTVRYFLQAYDAGGKIEKHPLIGESDPHKFYVESRFKSITQSIEQNTEVKVYPNPVADNLSLVVINAPASSALVKVKDINGRVVYQQKHDGLDMWYRGAVNLSHLSAGVYILEFSCGNEQFTQKIVKY